jgi:hypothetical protein
MKPPIAFSRNESDDAFARPVRGSAWSKIGTTSYAAGKYGNGLVLDGAGTGSQSLLVARSPQMTFSMWIKPTADPAAKTYGIIAATPSDSYAVQWGKAGASTNYFLTTNAGADGVFYSHANSYVNGTIAHWAFVFDKDASAGQKMKVYKDGVAVSITGYTDIGTGNWGTSNFTWQFGQSDGNDLVCVIDDIKIFNIALSLSEIKRVMAERGGLRDLVG